VILIKMRQTYSKNVKSKFPCVSVTKVSRICTSVLNIPPVLSSAFTYKTYDSKYRFVLQLEILYTVTIKSKNTKSGI